MHAPYDQWFLGINKIRQHKWYLILMTSYEEVPIYFTNSSLKKVRCRVSDYISSKWKYSDSDPDLFAQSLFLLVFETELWPRGLHWNHLDTQMVIIGSMLLFSIVMSLHVQIYYKCLISHLFFSCTEHGEILDDILKRNQVSVKFKNKLINKTPIKESVFHSSLK